VKKLIFISLLVISVCKGAAGPYAAWDQALQGIPNWQQQVLLYLSGNRIAAIPVNFNPPELQGLYLDHNRLGALPDNFNPPQLLVLNLSHNQFDHIYPEILNNFPKLRRLDLSNNPIYEGGPDGVNALRQYAAEHYPNLEIIADNILPGDPPGIDIKGD